MENLLGDKVSDPHLLEEMSLELHIHEGHLLPSYGTLDDDAVPLENTLLFAQALRENNIPFELHVYPHGPHGLSLANAETDDSGMGTFPHVATWMDLCIQWLEELRFA